MSTDALRKNLLYLMGPCAFHRLQEVNNAQEGPTASVNDSATPPHLIDPLNISSFSPCPNGPNLDDDELENRRRDHLSQGLGWYDG